MPDTTKTKASSDVQQVRERVLELARNIEQLSQSGIPPEQFFPEYLQLLVSSLGAQAGAIWMTGQGGMTLAAEVRFSETGIGEDPQSTRANGKLLTDVLSTGQASIYAPDDESGVELPTQNVIVLAAVQNESDPVGVVEIFQRPDAPAEARPGYLQFVEQMAGYASRYVERLQGDADAGPVNFLEDLEGFVLQLQRSLDLSEVAGTAANDGRYLLHCDRLSIALKRGRKTEIKAISGQDAVNPRANLVRTMAKLAAKIIPMHEPVVYTGKVEHLPDQISDPLAAYIQESGSRMVMLVPLFESERLIKPDDDSQGSRKRDHRGNAFGCMVIEQSSKSQPRAGLTEQVDLMADHVSAALFNARTHHRIILLPVWKFFGACLEWFHGRKLAKTIAILSAITAICLAMVFVRWDYRVEANGRLMPVVQREVFSPWDGEVVEVFVEGGDVVKKGEPLVRLDNDDLHAQLLESRNKLNQKRKLLIAVQAEIDDAVRGTDRNEVIRLQGQLVSTRVEIIGLDEQVKILSRREKELTVLSPINGVIATFQVDQLLRNRPVHRGEILVEVMDHTGVWHLELEVAEQRMGHILEAIKQRGEDNDNKEGEDPLSPEEALHLPVTFVLATSSEQTFEGELKEISTRAMTSSEEGSVIEVFASIADRQLPNQRIGAEVRAKINCGPKSLYYVIFGDVVEFIQKRVLF